MSEIPEVLCLGIAVADHVCTPVARLPAAGELVLADSMHLTVGGCAANVSMNLARLGRSVSIGCRVGDDSFGTFLTDTFSDSGVQTDHVQIDRQGHTSATFVINVHGEDRRFVHTLGTNAGYVADDITDQDLESAQVVYVGGFGLMPQLTAERVRDLFRRARSLGTPTVLDVVLSDAIDDPWAMIKPVLSETDVFLPNEDEARRLCDSDSVTAWAEQFRRAGAGTVIITRGQNGTVLVSDAERLSCPAFQVDAVDATGGGDAFAAGWIHAMLSGCDARRALQWASATGASCVRRMGATEGVFTDAELKSYLQHNTLPVESW